MKTDDSWQHILSGWQLDLDSLRHDLPITGSPERCLYRTVVETSGQLLFLLEELAPQTCQRKGQIAEQLETLGQRGLPVAAPLRGSNGHFIQDCADRFWQLSRFVTGVDLNRDNNWQDAWRGKALASFLAELQFKSTDLASQEKPFDLTAYVYRIEQDTRAHHPREHDELRRIFEYLHQELPKSTHLPACFSHGDPHPGNMIWGEESIVAAIDWEFCGPKCVLYDPALIIGCVGSEAEKALDGPLVREFLTELRRSGRLGAEAERHLPAWILGVRMGWLAEWLRRADREMIEFEIFYMHTLLQGR